MSSRMAAVRKQSSQTWVNLHSRLRSTPYNYSALFPEPVGDFVRSHAISISSCEGYVWNSILATTGFVLSQNSRVTYNGFSSKTKMYVLFVGPPSTGKSRAISSGCLDPLAALASDKETDSMVIGKSTSADLVQKLSEAEGGAMLVSSEVYDVINKMIKTDGKNGSGDISMLSPIFSGERVMVSYATQKSREISGDTPFGILGAIQPSPAAQLMTALDTGNGFIERLILTFPDCQRPSPSSTRTAKTTLEGKPSLTDVLLVVANLHNQETEYVFDDQSEQELDQLNEAYIEGINAAIVDGCTPPQSKRLDIVLRVAPAIHVLTSVMSQMLNNDQPTPPSRIIKKATLDNAISFVDFCESQKDTYLCELRNITDVAVTPKVHQPKKMDVTKAIIRTPGPVVNYRSFKSACSKNLRSVSRSEYDIAITKLNKMGATSTHRMTNGGRQLTVFVKKSPAAVDWSEDHVITETDYTKAFEKKVPNCITAGMQDSLVSMGLVTRDVFKK